MSTEIDETKGEALARSLSHHGAATLCFGANLKRKEAGGSLDDHKISPFGRLDEAFNNAGVAQQRKSLVELTRCDWVRIMAVNVQSMFHCLKHQFFGMKTGAANLDTSSGRGVVGPNHVAAYVSAKHAVCGLARAAAVEWAARIMRGKAILPGTFRMALFEKANAGPETDNAEQEPKRQCLMGRLGELVVISFLVRWP